MDKKASKVHERQKPNWDWSHVECYLKTVESNRKSIIWNLSPGIILTNPSTDNSGPSVRLYIDTQKSLQYSHELGWNWHKSWNIPNISLRLQIKDEITGDFLLAPRNLYAQIFAVKKNTDNEKIDRTTLVDVGIRGESKMEMIDGQVYFSAIKFSSTTYNNEGVNFSLLIALYINEGEFEKPKVLTAVMSPPIFVDSRRSARDYQEKKFSSFVEPFTYDTLDKEFIKRQNKSKCQSQILIKNDPEGFYNYITAPNIRHKVKHPVFLAIKFSNCVKIFYNNKLVTTTKPNELLEGLQTRLLKQNKSKPKVEVQPAINLEDKYFLFVISNLTDSLKRKKVIQSIETMQNQFIGIACGPDELPECMRPFQPIQNIKKAYKESYESLLNICQNYEPEEPEQSDDQYYSDQYEESSKSQKKKKEAEPLRTRNKTTIITNKKQPVEKPQLKVQKNEEVVLKKEEIFQSQFQAPVFFNNQNPEARKPTVSSSAFSKAVGFRNVNAVVENNPIFDTSQLNQAFSNNMGGNFNFNEDNRQPTGFKSSPKQANQLVNQRNEQVNPQAFNRPPTIPQNNPNQNNINSLNNNMNANGQANQPMANNFGAGNFNNNNNSACNNLMFGNASLSNFLSAVKSNNSGLYDNMINPTMSDQMMHSNNVERFMQSEQHQKMLQMGRLPVQNEEQQSIVCLLQQIGLYKELLSQITYQNQLLTRDISMKQNPVNHQFGGMNMNYMGMPGMNMDMNSTMGGNNMGGNNMGGNNMGGSMKSMANLNNMGSMGSMGSMNSMGNQQYSIPQGMINGSAYLNQGSMLNQMVMNGNLMQSQQNRSQSSQKQPQGQLPQLNLSNMSLPPNINPEIAAQMLGGGMNSNNYEIIKNMVLQDLKRAAEQKEKQRSDEPK